MNNKYLMHGQCKVSCHIEYENNLKLKDLSNFIEGINKGLSGRRILHGNDADYDVAPELLNIGNGSIVLDIIFFIAKEVTKEIIIGQIAEQCIKKFNQHVKFELLSDGFNLDIKFNKFRVTFRFQELD